MHLFKRSPLRPLPAGIPIDGENYSTLREHLLALEPLLDSQTAQITSRTGPFSSLADRQRKIHMELVRFIAPSALGASASWLMEFNDQRCAMELKEITLTRLLNEEREQLSSGKKEESNKISTEYTWRHWEGFLDNYSYLAYLSNRLLKELADYEHGKWYWVERGHPVLEPPLGPVGASRASRTPTTTPTAAAAAAAGTEPEKAGEAKEEKKTKHVKFERRVQGWYFNEDDLVVLTGKGLDEKERRNAEFHERVVDGKASTKALVEMAYRKKGGYERCTEGFKQPQKKKEVPFEYRLDKFRKPPYVAP